MSQPAIIVEGISKRYRLGHQASPHQTFREMATGMLAAPFRKLRSAHEGGAQGEEFWALKDVNFEVQPGEVVGIIGRNGAGKSTLLKILSRITEPTTGQIRMRGRVASLLEVGTGFHPELTGRENIYLNGAILGMKRAEITKKFDEIVAFAETEKFLDTPVKFYSSGMYVRLAFAVAAHLEPEILIVDEVLAVGDAEFQKKCLGKMKEVSKGEGRTVLFVSHNMSAVSELCERAALLNDGRAEVIGNVDEVINKYAVHATTLSSVDLATVEHAKRPQRYGVLTHFSVFDDSGAPTTTFRMGQGMIARLGVRVHCRTPSAEIAFKISSRMGTAIHYFCSTWEGMRRDLDPGDYFFEIRVPHLTLLPAKYVFGAWFGQEKGLTADDYVPDISMMEIIGDDFTGKSADYARYSISGCEVYTPSEWKMIT